MFLCHISPKQTTVRVGFSCSVSNVQIRAVKHGASQKRIHVLFFFTPTSIFVALELNRFIF